MKMLSKNVLGRKGRINVLEFSLVLPALVLYLVFVVYPLFGGFFYSLTSWNGITAKPLFIGFGNYRQFFHDSFVLQPLRNTFIFAFLSMVFLNFFGLLMALGAENVIGKNFYRMVLFIPSVLGALIVGYIFSFIFSQPVAELGIKFGIDVVANNILGDKRFALYIATVVAVWKGAGWYMVIYIAGLQTIDQSMYDAAIIDGASSWQKFKSVTFPLIAPAFTINMILSVENAFKEYDLMFALTGGGPGRSSELFSLTIYNESFTNKRAGYGAALGIVLFVIIVAITMLQLYILRRRENDISN